MDPLLILLIVLILLGSGGSLYVGSTHGVLETLVVVLLVVLIARLAQRGT